MLFVLRSERTDLEALLCCVATVKTDQPVGFTSQVTFCPTQQPLDTCVHLLG